MSNYKHEFVKFLIDGGVLKFGEFTLKSGRGSPYFLNMGNIASGASLSKLGGFYADCIESNNLPPDVIFGPAYKGIPLAAATASGLYSLYQKDIGFAFDRKETKDHGEGGVFVGSSLSAGTRVVIVDDVVTSGKALGEVLPKLRGVDADIAGFVIAVDRQEVGARPADGADSTCSAVQQIEKDYGIKVYSIVSLSDIIDSGAVPQEHLQAVMSYRERYGAK